MFFNNPMIKLISFCLFLFSLSACFQSDQSGTKNVEEQDFPVTSKSESKLRIKTVYGDIIIQLDHKSAPLTSDRILSLAKEGFYNGLPFHRVIPGFLVQTGDPTGTGEGGSGRNIPFEENSLRHKAGSVSMARREEDKNSGDSQFFISLKENKKLDGIYVVFGAVVSGLDVAKKLAQGDKIISLSLE